MPVSSIRATDEYDIILDYHRAETGETETGKLLYAGLIRGGKPKLSMLEWQKDGRAQWFEASGVGERRGGMVRPSGGRISSSYGRRRQPILGYTRMHTGVEFAGGYGAPSQPAHAGRAPAAAQTGRCGTDGKTPQC